MMEKERVIAVTGAGGTGGIDFARSLRASGKIFQLIGFDSSIYKIYLAETDKKILVPAAKEPSYMTSIKKAVSEFGIQLLHVQTSHEIPIISNARDELPCQLFLPSHETIAICDDKYQTYKLWKDHIKVPENILIDDVDDLKKAFTQLGHPLWLRLRRGSAGAGAIDTSSYELAKAWIDRYNGWGKFLAAVCLRKRTVTFESIWRNGELIVAQQRERLYWEHSSRAPSGVTGITGASMSVNYPDVTSIALKAIEIIDRSPNGVINVDLTYDNTNIPNPTEINAGRFMAPHGFFASAGTNFTDIFVKCALGEKAPHLGEKINPLPIGLIWIRGMDTKPVLLKASDVGIDISKHIFE